jgi:hypothetical protein
LTGAPQIFESAYKGFLLAGGYRVINTQVISTKSLITDTGVAK